MNVHIDPPAEFSDVVQAALAAAVQAADFLTVLFEVMKKPWAPWSCLRAGGRSGSPGMSRRSTGSCWTRVASRVFDSTAGEGRGMISLPARLSESK